MGEETHPSCLEAEEGTGFPCPYEKKTRGRDVTHLLLPRNIGRGGKGKASALPATAGSG